MQRTYTVKQLNAYIKDLFEKDVFLNRIYVKGEVSNCKYHTSGHIYFSLKDESGTVACVMFAGARAGLSFRMKDGQQVVILGQVSVYERSGAYQIYAKEIQLEGAGKLYEAFEARKKELAEMGMFSPEYKKPLPFYPQVIGIVTAPTGAAIRDMIQIATRRNPYVQLLLYPALVQGEGAAASIVRGISELERKEVDVIIVGRGGGSMEDLWAFNEEEVARAIFHCQIPVISAVGHETDVTIADFVADVRAATPSEAAELAIVEYAVITRTKQEYQTRLLRQMLLTVANRRRQLEQLELKLRHGHPKQKLRDNRLRGIDLEEKLSHAMESKLLYNKQRFALYVERMSGLSPLRKLQQGYAYMEDEQGQNIRTVEQVKIGSKVKIHVTDGRIEAKVTGLRSRRDLIER